VGCGEQGILGRMVLEGLNAVGETRPNSQCLWIYPSNMLVIYPEYLYIGVGKVNLQKPFADCIHACYI
jgi:hypothetical protein